MDWTDFPRQRMENMQHLRLGFVYLSVPAYARVKTIPKFVDGSGLYFHDRQTSVPFEAIRFSASPVRALKSTILAEWPIESQKI